MGNFFGGTPDPKHLMDTCCQFDERMHFELGVLYSDDVVQMDDSKRHLAARLSDIPVYIELLCRG